MTLRQQRKTGGREIPWTLDELKSGLAHFYKEHGKYPTATEVDAYPYLPSARSIERRFGGLVNLRTQLKLGSNADFRTGEHSSRRAHLINDRAHKTEQVVFDFLTKRFGRQFVHREYFFTDDHRTRADFFVFDDGDGFCVDVFYPNSIRNLTGCLNLKLNKYASEMLTKYPVIFLQMNESIDQATIDGLVGRKERKLTRGQHLMCWDTFQRFCTSRSALKISR
ncbi:hypothetical protein FJY93_04515 [Candidatus Kaiserbacteria bacterium]|nr:hypothetical protein [Candidatus Kaiserbacteria bacterium]